MAKRLIPLPRVMGVNGVIASAGTFTDTTDAASETSAPLKSAGGGAFAKKLYVGGTIRCAASDGLFFAPPLLGSQISPGIWRSSQTDDVSTSAIEITPSNLSANGGFALVNGRKQAPSETVGFLDLILVSNSGVQVLVSFTTAGSPDNRTYSVANSKLTLQMAANTYNVSVLEFRMPINSGD